MAKPAKAARTRGRGDETRAHLVDTALRVFNDVGFWGTDSNSLARAAGYSPGTFYRHFVDKRAIFLAAFEAWSSAEDERLDARLARAGRDRAAASGALVDFMIEHHARWRTFRASMRALADGDPELQSALREHRRRRLAVLVETFGRRVLARNLMVLYTLDGLGDALALGEPQKLGVSARDVTGHLRGLVVGDKSDKLDKPDRSSPRRG